MGAGVIVRQISDHTAKMFLDYYHLDCCKVKLKWSKAQENNACSQNSSRARGWVLALLASFLQADFLYMGAHSHSNHPL